MKLYIVVVEDSHIDTEVSVFDTPDAAISFARQLAKDSWDCEESYREFDTEGWLFHANYSFEDGCVWVAEKTLNQPEEY